MIAHNASSAIPLSTGAPDDRRRLRYANYHTTRDSRRLRVFIALAPSDEDGGVVLVQASHNRSTEPPAGFLARPVF